MGGLPLLQRIFLTQEMSRRLLHPRQILYQLSDRFVYRYELTMLYTWNWYNVIYQFYLSLTAKNKKGIHKERTGGIIKGY